MTLKILFFGLDIAFEIIYKANLSLTLSVAQRLADLPNLNIIISDGMTEYGQILKTIINVTMLALSRKHFLKIILSHVQHRSAHANGGSTNTTMAYAFHALLLPSKHY